ncbi:MAG: cysteine--tRNA ligase [Patescibacteria group bacterium]|nr:cysteine--tRNA ligase [Patescibacteria group bacterium]
MAKTEIYLYNTLSGKKELFKPLKAGVVGIYNCGPTVYDTAHIGNLRTFVMDDIVRRVFEYNEYKVTQVMNLTDVDDKTIRRATDEGIPLGDLTRRYEKAFLDDIHALNIQTPHSLLRATENIDSMIVLISTLIEKGFAYKANDGVYMSIEKVKEYGALAHLAKAKETKSRVANDEYDKESPQDFALWKFEDEGEIASNTRTSKAISSSMWNAPFGRGRPGWHIECSAMSMKVLGETIDIHTGASDLIFPHHTNEIAQSESATGKPFVHYWIHGGFMNVRDEKMAKSKGNFLKLADLESAGVSPLAFRYWLLTAHYRAPVNFTEDAVKAAQNAFIRLAEAFISCKSDQPGTIDGKHQEQFLAAINDDLNMPEAIAVVWSLVKDHHLSPADKRATLLDFDRVLGLGLSAVDELDDSPVSIENLPPEIFALSEARDEARADKDWQKADALRLEIESRGYDVKDTGDGSILKKKK